MREREEERSTTHIMSHVWCRDYIFDDEWEGGTKSLVIPTLISTEKIYYLSNFIIPPRDKQGNISPKKVIKNNWFGICSMYLCTMVESTAYSLITVLNQCNTLKWDSAHHDYFKVRKEHGVLHINIIFHVLKLKAYGKNKVGYYLHPSPHTIVLFQPFFYYNGSNTKTATSNHHPTLVDCCVRFRRLI